jgi:WD40 repeat protein
MRTVRAAVIPNFIQESPTVKYDAFMSYSHSADGALAPAVQKALHRLAKPWYRLRMLHVFRDQTSLSATPELWGSIEAALAQSEHFLLCASPEAAASPWVNDEITWWLNNRDRRKLFILLTGGEILWDTENGDFDWTVTTALPRTLSGAFEAEPLYVDLRFARDADDLSLRNTPFREAILNLAAPLHDRAKDELGGADVHEHRKTLRLAITAVLMLAALSIGALTAAWIATVQRDISRSRELAALARNQLVRDPAISLSLSVEAMDIRHTIQARQMLRTSLLQSLLRATLDGHTGAIHSLGFTGSGKRLVSSGMGGKMFVWSLANLHRVHVLEGYRSAVSVDGRRAVSSVKGNRLAVWDLASGERLAAFDGHSDTIFTLAISPDGRLVASGGRDNRVLVHEVETGQHVGNPIAAGGIVTELEFHPEGNLLAIGWIYNRILVWDLEAGKMRLETSGLRVAFSPDGSLLVTSGADGSGGRLIDLRTGKLIRTLREMPGSNHGISFSPDGKLFAAASSDGTARIWQRDGDPAAVLSGHQDWVEDVAFSPDGNFVVTASQDHTARVWSVRSGRELATLRGHRARVNTARFTPDGRRILTGAEDGSVRIWDTDMVIPRRVFAGHRRTVQQLAFSADGRYLIAAGDNGLTEIWDRERDSRVKALPGSVFALGPDGLATADNEHQVRLWNLDGSLRTELGGHSDIVSSLTFSPDQGLLVSTSEDGTARLFDLADPGSARIIRHDAGLSSAAFSPDGSRLATADYRGTARLWRLPELTPIATLVHSDKIISKIAFSPDGDNAITAGWDGTLKIWNAVRGELEQTLETALGQVYTFEQIERTGRLVTGGANGILELWDLNAGRRIAEYRGHSDGIYQVAINPAFGLFASASDDATTRLWDLQTRELITSYRAHGDSVWSVAFSADGRAIATGSEDGEVHLYACGVCASDDELMALASDRLSKLPPRQRQELSK